MKVLLSKKVPLIFKLLKNIKGKDYNFLLGLPKLNVNDYAKDIVSFEEGNRIIFGLLNGDEPVLITRFGSAELTVMLNGLFIENKKLTEWDIDKINLGIFNANAVFPSNNDTLKRFYDLYISCLQNINALAVWYNYGEHLFHKKYFKHAHLFPIESLEPFRFDYPWSIALKGKKVLVIIPFEKTVRSQYLRKENLFVNKNVLPDFKIEVYKPFNSYTDIPLFGKDWFYYLDKMIDDVKLIEFDIALVAAGPFGLPLASSIKEMGKKAVHIGGALQLLFGIKGNRWEERDEFVPFINDFWIKPSQEETPLKKVKNSIDNASYW